MIFVTGDTHGEIDFAKLNDLKKKRVTRDDILIICGDVGVCWSEHDLPRMVQMYESIGCTIFFVDGNHENFTMLEFNFSIVHRYGAKMHQISKYIYHVLRGEIMEIFGISFLCIGGAHSIDRMYRLPFISWWPDEEISNDDVKNAIANLEKYHNKVDYVISHCCDTNTVYGTFGFRGDDSSNQLQFIDKIVDYKHWYFGHYHFDHNISKKKTCLYKRILKLL